MGEQMFKYVNICFSHEWKIPLNTIYFTLTMLLLATHTCKAFLQKSVDNLLMEHKVNRNLMF